MANEVSLKNSLIRTCKSCGHVKVCAVFRAVAPLLSKSWDEETRPFEPESLASICGEYVDQKTIQILEEQM